MMIKKRMKKWSPQAKEKWQHSYLTKSQREELQRVYAARVRAKKKGQPVPPLPDFAPANRKRLEAMQNADAYKKRVQDKLRKRKERTEAKGKRLPMAARPSRPGKFAANGRRILAKEERAAKQTIYVQRSALRAKGVPENKLPPLPKAGDTVVWAKNKGPAKSGKSPEQKKAEQRVYQARSNAKRDGKPQPPLPKRDLTPEEHAAEQRAYAQQIDAAALQ